MREWLRLLLLPLAIAAATDVACSSSRGGDAGPGDAGPGDADTLDVEARDLTTTEAQTLDVPPEVETPDLGTPGDTADDAICAAGCQQGTDAGCGTSYDTCIAMCRRDFAGGICLPEKRAAQLCVIAAGPDAIMCVMGQTRVKPGYCASEKGTLTNCLLGQTVDAGVDAGSD